MKSVRTGQTIGTERIQVEIRNSNSFAHYRNVQELTDRLLKGSGYQYIVAEYGQTKFLSQRCA